MSALLFLGMSYTSKMSNFVAMSWRDRLPTGAPAHRTAGAAGRDDHAPHSPWRALPASALAHHPRTLPAGGVGGICRRAGVWEGRQECATLPTPPGPRSARWCPFWPRRPHPGSCLCLPSPVCAEPPRAGKYVPSYHWRPVARTVNFVRGVDSCSKFSTGS